MQVKKSTIIISLSVFAVVAIASGIILWKVLGSDNTSNTPSDAADNSCTKCRQITTLKVCHISYISCT